MFFNVFGKNKNKPDPNLNEPNPATGELGEKISARRRRQQREAAERISASAVILEIPESGSTAERTKALIELLNKNAKKEPIVCFRGDTDQPFIFDDRELRLTKLAEEIILDSGAYSTVLTYNAADSSFSFPGPESVADEYSQFVTENVEILDPSSGQNQIGNILDPKMLNSLANTDAQLFAIIKQLIAAVDEDDQNNNGICLVIDRADKLFPAVGGSPSGNKSHNESLIGSLKDSLGYNSPHRIILIDRNDVTRENTELRREILVTAVPELTKNDVARIITESGHEPSAELLQLSQGFSLTDLREILDEAKDGNVIDSIKRIKEEAVEKATSGALRCKTEPLSRDQVYMNEEMWLMLEEYAEEIQAGNWELLEYFLLMGPPGVGKSVYFEALASMLDVPYFQLNNISSSGLAGRKEDRVRVAIETAIRNKPCVLFIDEIDKLLPRTEGEQRNTGTDNDDSQVQAYLQTRLGSKEMEGVVVGGACNDPQRMNEALTRNGRFGKKIAILPPQTIEEKVGVFKKVTKQFKTYDEITLTDIFIEQVITAMGDEITTGVDYLAVLREGMRIHKRFETLHESILHTASNMNFAKTDKFHGFIQRALENHTAVFNPKYTGEVDAEYDKAVSMAKWEESLTQREKAFEDLNERIEAADVLVKQKEEQRDELVSEIETRTAEIERLKGQLEEQLQRADNQLVEANRTFEEQRTSITQQILEQEKALEEAKEKAAEAKTELDRYQLELPSKQAELRDLESQMAVLRATQKALLTGQGILEEEKQGDPKTLKASVIDKIIKQGGLVLEVDDKQSVLDIVLASDNLKFFDEDTFKDHGKTLEHLPDFEIEPGMYVVFPEIVEGSYNQTFETQQALVHELKSESPQLEGLNAEAVVPPIQVLAFFILQLKNQLFDKRREEILNEDTQLTLRSSTIVPDTTKYQKDPSTVGEYYEIDVDIDDDNDEAVILSLDSGNGDDIEKEDGAGAGKDTSMLQIFRLK